MWKIFDTNFAACQRIDFYTEPSREHAEQKSREPRTKAKRSIQFPLFLLIQLQ